MLKLLVLSVLLGVAVAAFTETEYQDAFRSFMHTHKKSYHHEEFRTRYSIFKNNMDFIEAHNKKGLSYTVGMNKFGDLTNEEFKRFYLGLKGAKAHPTKAPTAADPSLPSAWDWRDKGAVTPVKDQGQCGSCWSFSTTGSTEGCHFLTKGALVSLSEQNLMDCSSAQGNMGCDGGLMDSAMTYIIQNGGIDTEASYPYTAEDGTSCNYNPANSGATLSSFKDLPSGDENALQQAVSQGPVSVAIDAGEPSFQLYSSGVYYEPNCDPQSLDHGVLAVGWGTDPTGGDYWIVKNSWNTNWGMDGYIWMSRNKNNNCGIATAATLPHC